MREIAKSVDSQQGIIRQSWEIESISLSHNIVNYADFSTRRAHNDADVVRMHFGLSGQYDFTYTELNAAYSFAGHHNNIMYSDGLEIHVSNKSTQIETFGINFSVDSFLSIAQNGTDALKRFAEKIARKEASILSEEWRPNSFEIQSVIQQILHCPYENELKDLFLLSKSIELLVLQAELHSQPSETQFIRSQQDKQKLFEAKEILTLRLENPPSIRELAKLIALNEYKLKKGFKELFGTTVFGYIHKTRMTLAKRLLLGTDKTAKEVAYETGYSSPQHFSKAFKKEFGTTPDRMRKNPNLTP